jgi:pentatricopeptide repeat protein
MSLASEYKSGITTNTIAELYIKQGYFEKAVDIYRAILELEPDNEAASERLRELEARIEAAGAVEKDSTPAAKGGIDLQICRLEKWLDKIRQARFARGES